VPVRVQRYSEHLLLDSLALVDMPVAVTEVVNVGVPIARVGGLVVQLNLGQVSPCTVMQESLNKISSGEHTTQMKSEICQLPDHIPSEETILSAPSRLAFLSALLAVSA